MTQPNAESAAAGGTSAALRAGLASGKAAFLTWPALILLGVTFAGTNRVGARQEEETPASFVKIGKNYINIGRISHIFDDPGQPLPPGSMSVCFSGGSQNYMNLYGEDANAFREAIARMTTDLTPKASGEAAAPKKSTAGARKTTAPAGTSKKAAAPAGSPAGAPAASAPVADPGGGL